jgi:DNA-directed RNA polymerase specialized sigma subunit
MPKKATKKTAKKRAKKKVDPVDEAMSAQEKLAAKRRAEDLNLWEQWRQQPSQQTLSPLMRRFEPVFRSKVHQYKAPNVSTSAFRANLKLHTMNALETFNPAKAALRTHVENHLRKSMRFNAQNQNMAYIPEGQTAYIGAIDQARDELMDETGNEPSHSQIASFVNQRPDLLGGKRKLTSRSVATIQGNRRKDIIGSTIEGDPAPYAASRNEQVLGLLRPTLQPQEQKVFDHLYGMNGAPQVDRTSELAGRLGMSPSQVARLKSRIATKYKKYL